jgi:hypothetical protein
VTAFDVRSGGDAVQAAALAQRQATRQASPAVRSLSRQLGEQGVVEMDGLTGTPRLVARLDGMLTGPSAAPARQVALEYVRAHLDAFGLSAADVGGLTLARDYVDITGIHHLSFEQQAGGLTLFGNGPKANVAKNGSLINVSGSPVPSLAAPANAAAVNAEQAIRAAKRDGSESDVVPGRLDTAQAVLFDAPNGVRRGWQTVTMSAANPTLDVIDAQNGQVLYRQALSSDPADGTAAPSATAPATQPARPAAAKGATAATQYADVVDNYPGAAHGGQLHAVSLNQKGWLPKGSVVLYGNNAHTYADLNDNAAVDIGEEIGANGQQGYRFPLTTTHIADEPCPGAWVCTWDPSVPYSWQANQNHDGAQNFYYTNVWHDHLQAAPIGFTEAAGNLQQVNGSGQGLGGDPVYDQVLDGANLANGLPDVNQIDVGRMATPPDGQPAVMQLSLFHKPGTSYPDGDSYLATSGAEDAYLTYREYTNALPQRLLVDASNAPVVNSWQGRAMQVGWSDWYPADYLVSQRLTPDTASPGEIVVYPYLQAGVSASRTEAMDCPVGTASTKCPGTSRTGTGGYTYGQLSKVSRTGNVHGAGEFWAQTLWDIRSAVGSTLTESLVTRAMELSPAFPSMLDMRNAILQADQAIYGGKHVTTLWRLFAARGLGFFAGSNGGDDLNPIEDFSRPPAPGAPTATLTGAVTDSGAPLAGVAVGLAGHNSGFPGDYAATTDASGHYTIAGIPAGTYPYGSAGKAGYTTQMRPTVALGAGTTSLDWQIARDWAAASGGSRVTAFTGVDATLDQCGPQNMIDLSQHNGWGSTSDLDANGNPTEATAKYIVIKLPNPVDISQLAIDPSNSCSDDDKTAATGDYQVDTSADGSNWQQAAAGTFTPADLGKLVPVTLAGTTGQHVQYVRFWMRTPQAVSQHLGCPSSNVSGCLWLDAGELEVFGTAG